MHIGNIWALRSHSASDCDEAAPSGSKDEEKQREGGKIKPIQLPYQCLEPSPGFQLWGHCCFPVSHSVQGLESDSQGLDLGLRSHPGVCGGMEEGESPPAGSTEGFPVSMTV